MANSARPETDAMAKRMAELMDGPPEFHDCDDVTVWLRRRLRRRRLRPDHPGQDRRSGPAQAGHDRRHRRDLRQQRPDIIGGTFALDGRRLVHQHHRVHRRGERAGGREELQPAGGDAVRSCATSSSSTCTTLVRLGLTDQLAPSKAWSTASAKSPIEGNSRSYDQVAGRLRGGAPAVAVVTPVDPHRRQALALGRDVVVEQALGDVEQLGCGPRRARAAWRPGRGSGSRPACRRRRPRR